MSHCPASSALSRFTVLDLTRVRSGPTCVRQLADWGANVIKIEKPESISQGEQMGGVREDSDFQNLHRNKRSLSLNLKEEKAQTIFRKLARKADVVVENFRPEVKHRLGIDYKSLSKENSGLIYASISGFGQTGPYAKRPGFDQIAQGLGGLMSITGQPGGGPMRVGIPIADLTAGLFAAHGILIALLEREQSGKGQWLHTSLLEAQIFMLDFQSARWLIDGDIPQQAGNDHPTSIPTGVYQTSDGCINLSVSGHEMWSKLCVTLELEELIEHPDFNTEKQRSKYRDDLNSRLKPVIMEKSTDHWVTVLNKAGIPCGPINSIDQTFSDPQVLHLKVTQKVDSDTLGSLEFVGQPVTLERCPSHLRTAAPACGEHTEEILTELGYELAQITDLRDRKII